MFDHVQLRVLASGILFRAVLRALKRAPTPEQKMEVHRRVEDLVWQMSPALLIQVDGRDVDDGIPESLEWSAIVDALAREFA